MADLDAVKEALIRGDRDTVVTLVQEAIDENVAADAILKEALVAGMDMVGARFKANEFYVPEVLIAARAMNAGMDILAPLLAESGVQPAGIVVIGTVKGDLHDIGKNLVGMMLKGGGFKVIDAGIDVPPEKFVEIARESSAQIIGISALLTTSTTTMYFARRIEPIATTTAVTPGIRPLASPAANLTPKPTRKPMPQAIEPISELSQ